MKSFACSNLLNFIDINKHSIDNQTKIMFNNWRLFNLFWTIVVISCCISCQENPSKKTVVDKGIEASSVKNSAETVETTDTIDRFIPNPELESYLGLPILGKDFAVKLEYPKEEIRHPLEHNQFMLRIKGEIIPKSDVHLSGFKLRLFSNNVKDIKADKSIDEWDIVFKDDEHPFTFKFNNILNIEAGIYYYTIEQTESQELFYVGKMSLL